MLTGRHGVAVTEHSYHGNTSLLTRLSLLEYDNKDKPDWVGALPPPSARRDVPYKAGPMLLFGRPRRLVRSG